MPPNQCYERGWFTALATHPQTSKKLEFIYWSAALKRKTVAGFGREASLREGAMAPPIGPDTAERLTKKEIQHPSALTAWHGLFSRAQLRKINTFSMYAILNIALRRLTCFSETSNQTWLTRLPRIDRTRARATAGPSSQKNRSSLFDLTPDHKRKLQPITKYRSQQYRTLSDFIRGDICPKWARL